MTRTKQYKYYDIIMASFVIVLMCSNLIGPGKMSYIPFLGEDFRFEVSNLFFPFSYIFGDILTEVYGYKHTRRVIWLGFAGCFFAALMSYVMVHAPAISQDEYQGVLQEGLAIAFGNTGRVVLASFLAFLVGEFSNSIIMAKMKIWTQGKRLWTRTIGSTLVGQTVDSLIFYPIAFWGVLQSSDLLAALLSAILIKVSLEVVLTPFTYWAVFTLKKSESEDYYDTQTVFNPFSIKV